MLIREGHSTNTALTQITDDWLKEVADKKIVGGCFVRRQSFFRHYCDIIDQPAAGKTDVLWLYTPCYTVDKALPV
jgi:hypothetical protein